MEDTITVIYALEGGSSEKLGIKAGDKIVKVNDTVVAGIGIKNRECSGTIKGTNRNKPITKAYLLMIFKYVGHNFSIIPLMISVAKIREIIKD